MKTQTYLFLILSFLVISSCKKFLKTDPPPNQVTAEKVFTSDATATSALNGIYSEMMNGGDQFSASGVTLYAGLAADELSFYGPSFRDAFAANNITEAEHPVLEAYFWNAAYKYIYAANLALERLAASTGVSDPVVKQLTGEAKFIRAFCYFYLVNLFGDVPLALSSDYRINEHLPRAAVANVYEHIVSDLADVQNLLPATYDAGQRVRPTKWSALALLARVALYNNEWAKAENYASQVIGSGLHSLVPAPSGVFLKNSTEAIWQLLPVNPAANTWEANFILPATPAVPPTYFFMDSVISALESGDSRTAWFTKRVYQAQNIYYPTKYLVVTKNAPITEYYMVLRLAEQYLIRSEARAEQNNITGALNDINIIRMRAGLISLSSTSKEEVLSFIERERRIELAAEWGHRWFDLKRTGRATQVLASIKPGWQATDMLWPVPVNQLRINTTWQQNAGY